jgi:hypothetical protein
MTIDELQSAAVGVVDNAAVRLRAQNLASGLCEHGTYDDVCTPCEDGITLRASLSKETSEAVSKMVASAMWMSLSSLSNMDDERWREAQRESSKFLSYVGRLSEEHIREAAGLAPPASFDPASHA